MSKLKYDLIAFRECFHRKVKEGETLDHAFTFAVMHAERIQKCRYGVIRFLKDQYAATFDEKGETIEDVLASQEKEKGA